MTTNAVTLWSDKGPRACWDDPEVRAFLEVSRPPIIRIHTTPAALVSGGGKLTRDIRAELDGVVIWWAVTGDSNGPDPSKPWADAGRAALDAGVPVLELNCEQAWKERPRGTATRAIAALHTAAPSLEIGHTAYAGPVSIVVGHTSTGKPIRWGGHSSYPWREFLGPGSPVAWSAPQIYWAVGMTPATKRGMGPRTADYAARSWAEAVKKGWIRPDLPVDCYLQTYGCRTDDLCSVGTRYPRSSWWVAKRGHLRPAGMLAIRALGELHRRGFEGPDGIQAFQTAAGILVDGIVGPQTLGALGIHST